MKVFKFLLVLSLLFSLDSIAQAPTDFLSKDFHKDRREVLRSKMPKNSVAVVFANPLRNRANDVDYVFHQDPNFYYLTGYREPNGVLVLFSEEQTDAKGNTYNEILYVQKRDARAEQWNGKRLGVEGAKNELGFKMAFNASEFLSANIDYKKFDKVFIEKFNDDYRNLGGADIFDLVKSFKIKSAYNPDAYLSRMKEYVYSNIAQTPIESSANVINIIDRLATRSEEIKDDKLLNAYKTAESDAIRKEVQQKISLALKPKTNIDLDFLPTSLATMREVKTAEEVKLLTKAIRISAVGQIEVMKAMKPHMSETELQGIHEFVYK
ncbi:MAG: aminopeptidase P N-terminal domain-containing protein, partial [Polaribacter sp.]